MNITSFTQEGSCPRALRLLIVSVLILGSTHEPAQAQDGKQGFPPRKDFGRPYFCLNPLKWAGPMNWFQCVSEVNLCDPGLIYNDATGVCALPKSGLARIQFKGDVDFRDGGERITKGYYAIVDVVPEQVVTPRWGPGQQSAACGAANDDYPHQLVPVYNWADWYRTRLIVNANFFHAEKISTKNPYIGACTKIEGYVVSNRVEYSAPDDVNHALLFLDRGGQMQAGAKAKIVAPGEIAAYKPHVLNAVAGMRLLDQGNVPRFDPDQHKPNAYVGRTAVGVTRGGDQLIVVVVQSGDRSGAAGSGGTRLTALAEYMKSLGAYDAINFDGGGSSQLIYDDSLDTFVHTLPGDRPIHGLPDRATYRPVPAFIGFR